LTYKPRKTILALNIILSACIGVTHAQAVFRKYGYKKAPLTLSKGKYDEFFTNDEVVQIGTIKLNTRTNKVIQLLEEDTTKTNYLSDRSSVWYSVDPLAHKYPNYSPYVYCMGNPVKYVDPDGREVVIWYVDKGGNDQAYKFNGSNKMAPNNQYVKDFIQAYHFNVKNGGGDNTKEAVTNPKLKIYISDSKSDVDRYESDAVQPTVYWESRQGTKTTEGGKQSAATALEHELDHAVDDIKNTEAHHTRRKTDDVKFDNKEERRVINGSETKTAKANGESIRNNHKGESYKTINPISTKPSKN
jgi:hypothetical protein